MCEGTGAVRPEACRDDTDAVVQKKTSGNVQSCSQVGTYCTSARYGAFFSDICPRTCRTCQESGASRVDFLVAVPPEKRASTVAAAVQRTSPEEGEAASDSWHAGGSREPPGTI